MNFQKRKNDQPPHPMSLHILTVQSGEAWVGWKQDGELEFSEGYEPDPTSRELFRILGPMIKSHCRRTAPEAKKRPRQKVYIPPEEIGDEQEGSDA